jgi:hypothetical protein
MENLRIAGAQGEIRTFDLTNTSCVSTQLAPMFGKLHVVLIQ